MFLKIMCGLNFIEIMRYVPEGLNPFKIQIRFKLEFASRIYNSKSREILNLDQKQELS
jgi:hypothetical protein